MPRIFFMAGLNSFSHCSNCLTTGIMDISTDKVAGDQPIENIIRLKPKETGHEDGEVLAIVTIVTERYRTCLLYTSRCV